jgi:signal transduction histidine kinase
MILPTKYKLGFALMLIGIAVLLIAGGAWAIFTGYDYVLVDAAAGSMTDLQHLRDLFVLQSTLLEVAIVVSVFLSIALLMLYLTKLRIDRNAALIADSLKAFAAGDWEHLPHIHQGDALDEVAAAAASLAEAMQARGKGGAEGKEIEEIKTRFLEIISHQLRTPLTSVRWNIESLLRGEEGALSRKQMAVLRITDKNYQNILVMLSDWIEALEVERGLLHLNPEAIDVAAFLKSVEAEFKSHAQFKDLSLRLSISKGLPSVHADRLKLHYVFNKLLHNALSYTNEGGRVSLRVRPEGGMVRFEIEDSGVGIPPDEQADIFKKFFRASNASLMQPYASGVGLFVTKTLIEAQGGTIGFTSVEGKGTVFSFTLPISESPSSAPHAPAPAARRTRRPAVPGRSRRRSP